MPAPLPRCSVVIPTHERQGPLRALVEDLDREGSSFLEEVVVVDDSARPAELPSRVAGVALVHDAVPKRLFISEAKNRGWRRARSKIVFFLDDDNRLTPTTFAHPLTLLAERPRLGAVMPSVLYHRDPGRVWVYATPLLPGRWEFDLVGRNGPRRAAWEGRLLPTDALPNASFVRREALESVGGLDDRSLPVNSSADLCQRLQRAGWETGADTSAFVRHDVELPGTRGWWGAHSVDAPRLYYEAHDWFVFQRRIRADEGWVRPRALLHSARWVLPSVLAFLLREDARAGSLTVQLVRGGVAGLRGPVPPAPRGDEARP